MGYKHTHCIVVALAGPVAVSVAVDVVAAVDAVGAQRVLHF